MLRHGLGSDTDEAVEAHGEAGGRVHSRTQGQGAAAERTAGGEKPDLGVQKPDPGVQERLEGIAKKFRFKDFDEHDDVAANIAHVMAGMDPQTKRFTDAPAAIKREIDEVAADKSIPEEERKRVLEELEAASSTAQPIQLPSTIEIITKCYDRLQKTLLK